MFVSLCERQKNVRTSKYFRNNVLGLESVSQTCFSRVSFAGINVRNPPDTAILIMRIVFANCSHKLADVLAKIDERQWRRISKGREGPCGLTIE